MLNKFEIITPSPILVVNWHTARKGRKIASDKLAFLYAFAIITINKWSVQQTAVLNAATADAHTV